MKHHRPGYRRIPMNQQMIDILDEQKERFRQKFGRDPRPQDPVLFDDDYDEPRPLSAQKFQRILLDALKEANTRPEIIFAVEKTGFLVTEYNKYRLTPAEYQQWCDAIDEYRRLHPDN
jgi:hypothetical protein